MHYSAKRDANQPAIVAALKRAGASVVDLAAVGKGVPDLLVGRNGTTFLIEVKDASQNAHHAKSEDNPDGELTDLQVEFLSSWAGQRVHIVHDEREALGVVCATELEIEAALAAKE